MKIYHIKKTGEKLIKYEIYHDFNGRQAFDKYTLTKIGAKYQALKFIAEDLIKYDL